MIKPRVPCEDLGCVASNGKNGCTDEAVISDFLRGKDSCIGRRAPGDMSWQRKYLDNQGLPFGEKCTIQEKEA